MRREFKSVAIGIGLAVYVLIIATRPYISEPGVSHELIRLAREARDDREDLFRAMTERPSVQTLQRLREGTLQADEDPARIARFDEIVAKFGGMPTAKQVGDEGVQAARFLQRLKDGRAFAGEYFPAPPLDEGAGAERGETDDYEVVVGNP